jgi:hypothetical protein
MQGTFPHCKKRLPSDHALCSLVIEVIVLVHNFRMDYVGYNQIETVFDPEYVWIENLQGYDQIAQYYFRPGDYNSKVDGDGTDNDNESNKEKPYNGSNINIIIMTMIATRSSHTMVVTLSFLSLNGQLLLPTCRQLPRP